MKYAVWVVRLVFAAWMIPSGLNHFIPLFPQPMGSKPLSHELIVALLDSHLFDLVKAVELLAGLSVLTGIFTPLVLLMCMPVSFCVFFWDTPLEGWASRAAIFGCCGAAVQRGAVPVLPEDLPLDVRPALMPRRLRRSRRTRNRPSCGGPVMKQLILVGRLIFGAWMLANGANHFFFSLWPTPTGHEPLAIQLMAALVHSGLFDVAMTIQLVTGALILAGLLVPVALCVVMPISTCALYWSVILDHQPLGAAWRLPPSPSTALLMLAYLEYYRGALQRHALSTDRISGGAEVL